MSKNPVQPGVNPAVGEESLVEPAHDGFVLRGVADKDAKFAVRHEGFPKRGIMVKLYGRN